MAFFDIARFTCLVTGVGLVVSCARGEQVDREHVDLLPPPKHEVPDSGDESGGRAGGGSAGAARAPEQVLPGAGGTPPEVGGHGAGAALGRGDGGAGDGGQGSGGTRAGGTTGEGGSPAAGKASGGTPSGGAGGVAGGAAGGSTSGGSAGTAGGGGGGGAMECPGYPTVDVCSTCACKHCASEIKQCFASGDATKDTQCKLVEQCAEANHCVGQPCYCGNAVLCLPPRGKCADVLNTASGVANPGPSQIARDAMDTTHPIGRAVAVETCAQTNCSSECGL